MQFDMKSQIHQLEQEAYGSVLRAFKAQSDAITWEKEGLITELRKELRVSDDEHRELLTRVNADKIICRIREWRKACENHTTASQPMHELVSSPTFSESWKKQKTSQPLPSFTAGGNISRPGMSTGYLSTLPTPGGLNSNNNAPSVTLLTDDRADAAKVDPLIGRKVMTRWPGDDNFQEAEIIDYNAREGRHALVYDRNTHKEAWEWVDLNEVAAYIRWVDEDPGSSHHIRLNKQGSRVENCVNASTYPYSGNGATRDQFEKELAPSQNVLASKDIEILHTETLIKEVQKLFGSNHPNLLEIEKAKKMLKEHEQALLDVISKISDVMDGENDGHQQSPHGQTTEGEQRWRNVIYSGNTGSPMPGVETR